MSAQNVSFRPGDLGQAVDLGGTGDPSGRSPVLLGRLGMIGLAGTVPEGSLAILVCTERLVNDEFVPGLLGHGGVLGWVNCSEWRRA